jgi:hypothetical protein
MRNLFALFQTADGGWHWVSILTVVSWIVGGVFIFASLVINRNERLKQGGWEFSKEQEKTLSASLKDAVKGKIAIEYTRADEKRAHDFALKLKAIFESSGYDVWAYMPAFTQASGDPVTGIQIQIKRNQPSDTVGSFIQRAFKEINIEATGVVSTNNNYEDDRAVILVGIKP